MSTEGKILTTLVRDLRIMQESENERNGDAAPQTARHAAEKIESLSVRLYWAERNLASALDALKWPQGEDRSSEPPGGGQAMSETVNWEKAYRDQTERVAELRRENAALREALEISDDYINQMLHGDIELTHGELEAWRNVIYPLRTKEGQP